MTVYNYGRDPEHEAELEKWYAERDAEKIKLWRERLRSEAINLQFVGDLLMSVNEEHKDEKEKILFQVGGDKLVNEYISYIEEMLPTPFCGEKNRYNEKEFFSSLPSPDKVLAFDLKLTSSFKNKLFALQARVYYLRQDFKEFSHHLDKVTDLGDIPLAENFYAGELYWAEENIKYKLKGLYHLSFVAGHENINNKFAKYAREFLSNICISSKKSIDDEKFEEDIDPEPFEKNYGVHIAKLLFQEITRLEGELLTLEREKQSSKFIGNARDHLKGLERLAKKIMELQPIQVNGRMSLLWKTLDLVQRNIEAHNDMYKNFSDAIKRVRNRCAIPESYKHKKWISIKPKVKKLLDNSDFLHQKKGEQLYVGLDELHHQAIEIKNIIEGIFSPALFKMFETESLWIDMHSSFQSLIEKIEEVISHRDVSPVLGEAAEPAEAKDEYVPGL